MINREGMQGMSERRARRERGREARGARPGVRKGLIVTEASVGRRPIELGDAQRREVETLAALLNQEQIADYLGICRRTFQAILERDEEVAARYKRGKAKAIAHVANGLLQKARSGDTASSIFYLKTQAGWRETERLEHSGPNGTPIEISSASDELHRFLDRLHLQMRKVGHPAIEAHAGAGLEAPATERIGPVGGRHEDAG